MIPWKCRIKKFWQSGRLVDPLCQHITEQHMHPGCGHFNHPYVTDYHQAKFQVYYMPKSHGSYLCYIYLAHKYIFDASMLWKEMVDILLLTFLELSLLLPHRYLSVGLVHMAVNGIDLFSVPD